MRDMGYSATEFTNYSSECLISDLNQNRLVIMSGNEGSSESGHAWIVDGYIKRIVRTITFNAIVGSGASQIEDLVTYYNHINWGWDGCANGYFLGNVFDVMNASTYDNSPYSPSDYSLYQADFKSYLQYSVIYR